MPGRGLTFGWTGIVILSALWSCQTNGEDEGNEVEVTRPPPPPLLKTFRGEFVAIRPGEGGFPASYLRGSEGGPASETPVRQVTLDHSFGMAAYEVPQNLWEFVMGSNPSRWKGDRNSVEELSLDEALEFCREATRMMRDAGLIAPQKVVRLPSEAEWEYCARAGTTTRYSFGDSEEPLDDHAWSTGNAKGEDPAVGALEPNAWKLYDVHGYLWEWCLDSWQDDYTTAPTDGSAHISKTGDGVLRGGSWKDTAEKLTSSYRRRAARDLRDDAVGLRCVLSRTDASGGRARD